MPVSNTEYSDPSMVLVPSVHKYTSDITFFASAVNVGGTITEARNYITIVATTTARDTLTLDGTPIGQYYYSHLLLMRLFGSLQRLGN